MTSPRLVATDLDGTLLDSTGSITPRTRRALDLARAAGAEIVFVTARPPRGVDRITPQTGEGGVAVCSNGAIVYDTATREIVTSRTLDPAVAAKVAMLLSETMPGVGFAVETGWNVLAEPAYDRILLFDQEYRRDLPGLDSLWDSGEPIVKLMAWSRGHTADDMLAVALAAVDGQAEITHSGGTGLLEISAAGVTKAGTLALLCAERGLAPQDVVAFGDMPNDLAVLAYAGLPYGMANAHPLVLESVPNRTLSNDEDGVAVVLERLYAR
ncbi:Cof-type HAD-IIB family hydrolase [Nonomuraea sp. NPDC050536]|uniref:Cof-type HAD-IIB family hydrolase n=1 Tax=Nonomuraea sp. NPDC050536 TaxID=3364366 RepID=UPI0037CAAFE1